MGQHQRVEQRARDGARALGCERAAVACAASRARYYHWRGIGRHRAVDWGIRDGLAQQRKRDLEVALAGEVA